MPRFTTPHKASHAHGLQVGPPIISIQSPPRAVFRGGIPAAEDRTGSRAPVYHQRLPVPAARGLPEVRYGRRRCVTLENWCRCCSLTTSPRVVPPLALGRDRLGDQDWKSDATPATDSLIIGHGKRLGSARLGGSLRPVWESRSSVWCELEDWPCWMTSPRVSECVLVLVQSLFTR